MSAAGLLPRARRAGDIDRLLQRRRAAGECGQCHVVSVRTQSCSLIIRVYSYLKEALIHGIRLEPRQLVDGQ